MIGDVAKQKPVPPIMQALRFLHTMLALALPNIHAARLKALLAGVHALLNGGVLSLTALGRSLPTKALEKHAIKRMDRLLGNPNLHAERPLIYDWLCKLLLTSIPHPLLLVDWSGIDAGDSLYLLRAAVPIGGRAIPIYQRVHSKSNCSDAQENMLKVLAKMIPASCRPVFVTDAGFRCPWFKAVQSHGWYYVGRLRNREKIRFSDGCDTDLYALYADASNTPEALGTVLVTATHGFQSQLFRYLGESKGRKHRTNKGTPSRDSSSRACAKRESEPWLLVSNFYALDSNGAKRIVRIYETRMQIEEGFRDLKSGRYGFAFRQQGCKGPKRVEILLLLAALATYALILCGLKATANLTAKHYQANTERQRRVLSLAYLGQQVWKREERSPPRQNRAPRLLRDIHRLLLLITGNESKCVLS